jgi:hypothetical protein
LFVSQSLPFSPPLPKQFAQATWATPESAQSAINVRPSPIPFGPSLVLGVTDG